MESKKASCSFKFGEEPLTAKNSSTSRIYSDFATDQVNKPRWYTVPATRLSELDNLEIGTKFMDITEMEVLTNS